MKIKKSWRFIFPLLWMGLIFFASAQKRVAVTGDYLLSFVIFKSLHLIIYAILFLLWRIALPGIKNAGIIAMIISITYGAADELHQGFVPTREGTIRDVVIDAFGVILAWQLIWPKIKNKFERG